MSWPYLAYAVDLEAARTVYAEDVDLADSNARGPVLDRLARAWPGYQIQLVPAWDSRGVRVQSAATWKQSQLAQAGVTTMLPTTARAARIELAPGATPGTALALPPNSTRPLTPIAPVFDVMGPGIALRVAPPAQLDRQPAKQVTLDADGHYKAPDPHLVASPKTAGGSAGLLLAAAALAAVLFL